jgi:hypothetical protein
MNKKYTFTILCLACILFSIGLSTSYALTPSGYWGLSTGDAVYYKFTDNREGGFGTQYFKVEVNEIYDGSFEAGGYTYYFNLINATSNIYYGGQYVPIAAETIWAGYNETTNTWYGAMLLLYFTAAPAPIPLDIQFINHSICTYGFPFTFWGSVSSSLTGNKLTYTNATDTLIVEYNTNGLCINTTHLVGTELLVAQEYMGETDPMAGTAIPGFDPIIFFGVSVFVVLFIVSRLKYKRK